MAPRNSVLGFETGVGSGRPWPDPAGDLGGVECCLAHHSEMSLVVHRRADAGIKSIGWNLDVWTKVGQRPISKFQNDANLGRQLATFATGPDRRSDGGLNDVLGEGKEAPRFNGKIRRCSPVLLSWMNCQEVVNLGVEMDCCPSLDSETNLGSSSHHLYRKVWLQGTFRSKLSLFLVQHTAIQPLLDSFSAPRHFTHPQPLRIFSSSPPACSNNQTLHPRFRGRTRARTTSALATHEAVVSGSDWQAPPNPLPQACDNLDNDPTRREDALCCWLSRTLPPTRPVTEARIRPLRSQPRARSPAEAASTQHPCQQVAPVAP